MPSTSAGDPYWGTPHLPQCPTMSIDGKSLSSIRDSMTTMAPDTTVEHAIDSVFTQWSDDRDSVEPLSELQSIIEDIRKLPRGDERLRAMNTFVRTIGEPLKLASFLDMMRDSVRRPGSRDEELTRPSRTARKHSVYGWAGQTLFFFSEMDATSGTVAPEPGVRELIGEPPPVAVWGLSMNIWQPNPRARAFPSRGRIPAGRIVEPPHSHPFDFASMVAKGLIRESRYVQQTPDAAVTDDASTEGPGRYDGVLLEHVDGVWPEHEQRSSCEIRQVERSLEFRAGESYFMPSDMIHDVEIDASTAADAPTITVLLTSEIVVKPHVYMAPSMADFHDANPTLNEAGEALSASAWDEKFQAVSAYLRGEQSTLHLEDIVKYDGEYAFFHAA